MEWRFIFMDVDGVLAIDRFRNAAGELVPGVTDEEWSFMVHGSGVYRECIAPQCMIDFLKKHQRRSKLRVLTAVENSAEYWNKVDFISNNYGDFFRADRNVCFVSSTGAKLDFLENFATMNQCLRREILLVDDDFNLVRKACIEGFSAMHVSQFLVGAKCVES